MHPKITALDECTIVIGQKLWIRNKAPMIPEFVPILNHAGTHVHLTAELGTSLEKLMSSDEPLMKSLSNGFRVEAKSCMISNMKRVFMEMGKSEEHMEKIGPAMMIAPGFMLALNGKVNIKFNDFEEVEQHPMAAPLMATFEQLFEGMTGKTPSEFKEQKFDVSGCKPQPGTEQSLILKVVEFHSLVQALVNDMPTASHINVNVNCPDMLVNTEVDINAPGLKQALALALHLPIERIQEMGLDRMKGGDDEGY